MVVRTTILYASIGTMCSILFTTGCEAYVLSPSVLKRTSMKRSSVRPSAIELRPLKAYNVLGPMNGRLRFQKSSVTIRLSNKNQIEEDDQTEKGFPQKAIEFLQTPITLPIPAFVASLFLGGATITAGIFLSLYLIVTSPDQPEVTVNVVPQNPQAQDGQQQGEPQLSEAQKDTIIFNQILSGKIELSFMCTKTLFASKKSHSN